MTAPTLARSPAVEGVTEKFDPIAYLDERSRTRAKLPEPGKPGRYIEVQGPSAFLKTVLDECAAIHRSLYDAFVAYSLEDRLPA